MEEGLVWDNGGVSGTAYIYIGGVSGTAYILEERLVQHVYWRSVWYSMYIGGVSGIG